MRNKSFNLLTGLFIFPVAISSILLIAGCAPSFHSAARTTAPHESARASVRNTPATQTTPTRPIASPTLAMLPEAGGPRPTNQMLSPTPLPPTPRPVKPTIISTQVPVVNSPTSVPHFAPVRIVIPAIGLDAPVITVGWTVTEENGQQASEWDVPSERVAGWLNTSALVGAQGNTVLVGHQNIDGRVFENLEYLKSGDEIQLQAGAERHKYVVTMRMILPEKGQPIEVRRENARWIGRSNDERLTLVTCWPRNDNTHRLILVALPAR